jgi:hypothetical protein
LYFVQIVYGTSYYRDKEVVLIFFVRFRARRFIEYIHDARFVNKNTELQENEFIELLNTASNNLKQTIEHLKW